jgi:energy-coupling factor transporter ATP-binding protein EcfA2
MNLNGINTAQHGRWWGLPVTKQHMKEIRRRVGTFQDPDDWPFMPTVRADVAFGPVIMGVRGDDLDASARVGGEFIGRRTI